MFLKSFAYKALEQVSLPGLHRPCDIAAGGQPRDGPQLWMVLVTVTSESEPPLGGDSSWARMHPQCRTAGFKQLSPTTSPPPCRQNLAPFKIDLRFFIQYSK